MVKRETEVASAFVTGQLKGLTVVQTRAFSRSLLREMQLKFQRHWYPESPLQGQALRSILVDLSVGFIDATILKAASLAGIERLLAHLPSQPFQLWVDPGEVEVCNPKDSSSNQIVFRATRFHTYLSSHLEPLVSTLFGSPSSSSISISLPSAAASASVDAQQGCSDQARSIHKQHQHQSSVTLSRHVPEQRSVH